jgi:hypothetical protein
MKANELRIGNFLLEKSEIVHVGFNTFKNWERFKLSLHLEPIPLTEEILLKCGFEFRNKINQYGWYLLVSQNRVLVWCHAKEISLEFDKETYDYDNTLFDFDCEYLHQLQNLYFALTGKVKAK